MQQALITPTRTTTRCVVCGCREVRTDEVLDRGWVLLSECPRCEHRWTSRAEPGPRIHKVRRPRVARTEVAAEASREVASAA